MFFSIVIPAYNREAILAQTIQSVLDQTFDDYEILIIDDASTDNTQAVVASFASDKIRYFKNETNQERCISRNVGIMHATGQYICFLDSDDRFLPIHLETFHAHLAQQNFPEIMVFSNSYLETESGERSEKKVPPFDPSDRFAYLLLYTPNPARVCVSKKILESIQFDPAIPGLEDLDLWLRIAANFEIQHIQKFTNIYFIHSGMYTLADTKRYEKELRFFKLIFSKPELKGKLPKKSQNRLLSMCHFHLSQAANQSGNKKAALKHALTSFFLYPGGYNGRTNKIVLVTVLHNIPLLGNLLKKRSA